MPGVSVDVTDEQDTAQEQRKERRRQRQSRAQVEIEREVTKRHLIEAVTSIVVVVLYMVFTLVRDREAGVVVLDPDESAEDDWDE